MADFNQIIIQGNLHHVGKIILNRPQQLNSFSHQMVMQLIKALEEYEVDDTVGLLILTGQGKAFSSGGDIVRSYRHLSQGHWNWEARIYSKVLRLQHIVATYKKPLVVVMNGIAMGGGAALAMNATFRIVTHNTVFAMPEVSIGFFPDVGISYFLSRLSGHYGEYLGLTGARISGIEMLASGLATHFIMSKDLNSLESELSKMTCVDGSTISNVIEKFMHIPNLRQDSAFARLDIINKCFSKKTVEDILSSLESEIMKCGDRWMVNAINSMKAAHPTCLKICLKNIREGRNSTREECLMRDYTIFCNIMRGKLSRDIHLEGIRAVLIDKDKRPKWDLLKLEEVSDEYVNRFFQDLPSDANLERLELSDQRKITKTKISKL